MSGKNTLIFVIEWSSLSQMSFHFQATLGQTKVFASVTATVAEPSPSRPCEGVLQIYIDFLPMCAPRFVDAKYDVIWLSVQPFFALKSFIAFKIFIIDGWSNGNSSGHWALLEGIQMSWHGVTLHCSRRKSLANKARKCYLIASGFEWNHICF